MNTNEIRHQAQRHEMISNLCSSVQRVSETIQYQQTLLQNLQINREKNFKKIDELINKAGCLDDIKENHLKIEELNKSSLEMKQNIKDLREVLNNRHDIQYKLFLHLRNIFVYLLMQVKCMGNHAFTAKPYIFRGPYS